MDASMLAAFVGLALCIPLIGVAVAARALLMINRLGGRGDHDDEGPPRRHAPPPGGDPYHLP